ncbi:MAG TPA: hypothetical protein VNR39_07435 [Pseudolabrys sp.]|nr:hypothetical protein [Pseudolabrys sp.]
MTVRPVGVLLVLAGFVAAGLFAGAVRAEPAVSCKAGSDQSLTGVISMAPVKDDSVGGWMIVAPRLDDANACKVMDFIGKGAPPKECAEKTRFKAAGTVDAAGYALQVRKITCQ